MADPSDLQRFVDAQDRDATYDQALAELRRGRKAAHWMWFVFPQLAGLGMSSMSQTYAIRSLEEARAYLAHPILGPRLCECTAAVLGAGPRSAEEILGGIDAQKLRSSMTLVHRAAPDELSFAEVLERFFAGEPDERTDALLAGV